MRAADERRCPWLLRQGAFSHGGLTEATGEAGVGRRGEAVFGVRVAALERGHQVGKEGARLKVGTLEPRSQGRGTKGLTPATLAEWLCAAGRVVYGPFRVRPCSVSIVILGFHFWTSALCLLFSTHSWQGLRRAQEAKEGPQLLKNASHKEARASHIFLPPSLILNAWGLTIEILYWYGIYFFPLIRQVIIELLLSTKPCAKYFSSFNSHVNL